MWLGFEVEETLRVHIKVVMMKQHEKKRKSQSMTTVRKGDGLGRLTVLLSILLLGLYASFTSEPNVTGVCTSNMWA
jgi:hypothetical protein